MKDMGQVQFVFRICPKEKKLEVVASAIESQFGVNFKIRFLVVQKQDHWLRSIFKKEIAFPASEASFVHLEAQMKRYLKHEHTKYSCVPKPLRALQK